MTDFFDKFYSSITDKNKLLKSVHFYSLLRFSIRIIANILLPIYYVLTRRSKEFRLTNLQNDTGIEPKIIVSLTSFPPRIKKIWLTIETLLRQKDKPDRIILWLSVDEFCNRTFLPKTLTRLEKRGLEIRFCEGNLLPHKKYYYAIKEFPADIIITVDDDVLYNSKLITYLLESHNKFPECMICNRSLKVNVEKDKILSYKTWKLNCIANVPAEDIFPVGIGGVLYPPSSLHTMVLQNEVFMQVCAKADDIWLFMLGKLNNKMAVQTEYNSFYLPIINFKNITLSNDNIDSGKNDIQFKALRSYIIETRQIDPIEKLLKYNNF